MSERCNCTHEKRHHHWGAGQREFCMVDDCDCKVFATPPAVESEIKRPALMHYKGTNDDVTELVDYALQVEKQRDASDKACKLAFGMAHKRQAKLTEAKALLKEVEWVGSECGFCDAEWEGSDSPRTHDTDCRLNQLLKEGNDEKTK